MIIISKTTQKQTITAIKSGDFSEVDKIKESAKKDARKVFDAVSSGAVSLIWYDLPPVRCQSGVVSVMRYALCWFVTSAGLFPVVPFICLFNGLYLHYGTFYRIRL